MARQHKPASASARSRPNTLEGAHLGLSASKGKRAIQKLGQRYRLRPPAIEPASWRAHDLNGLHRAFTVIATVAYVDTITLFHSGMLRDARYQRNAGIKLKNVATREKRWCDI